VWTIMRTEVLLPIMPRSSESYPLGKSWQCECWRGLLYCIQQLPSWYGTATYEGWNFNSGNYLFTTDTK